MSSAVHSTGERDGLPTVIMESLMHRLPVVATDVCGIHEVIQDGVTGLLVPEKNPVALANAIIKMVENRKSALEMAERGRSRFCEEFDQERNAGKILKLYQTLIRRPGRRNEFRRLLSETRGRNCPSIGVEVSGLGRSASGRPVRGADRATQVMDQGMTENSRRLSVRCFWFKISNSAALNAMLSIYSSTWIGASFRRSCGF